MSVHSLLSVSDDFVVLCRLRRFHSLLSLSDISVVYRFVGLVAFYD